MILKRRKNKSNTPIIFGLSLKDAIKLKTMIRPSLAAFKENRQSLTDWHNVGFRLKVALEVAKEHYVLETVSELQRCMDAVLAIKQRYATHQSLSATPEEIELFEMGLDAMDQIQDESTRRLLLDKFLAADRYMKALSAQKA